MTASIATGSAAASSTPRVLVVDDERDMLELLQDILEAEGYEVVAADSGERALEVLAHDSFDVAITDLRMPGIGGLDALLAMKRIDPRMPVLVVSGFASDDTVKSCRSGGAFECLQKPVDLGVLLHHLAAARDSRGG